MTLVRQCDMEKSFNLDICYLLISPFNSVIILNRKGHLAGNWSFIVR